MININSLRRSQPALITLGNYPAIAQAILDFDFLSGRASPSIVAIQTAGLKTQKLFWGIREILVPCYATLDELKAAIKPAPQLFINFNSGRRAHPSTVDFFEHFPQSLGGHIFAEDVPEAMALDLFNRYQRKHFIVGPSGVGLLLPGYLKLGAVGGTDYQQLTASYLFTPGDTAVISASGGMINEVIRMLARADQRISFALTLGGDRWPITAPEEAFLAAQADPATKRIVYYGELGGADEYRLVDLINAKKVTKPVLCYIAGTIAASFERPVQFGHAKALAQHSDESAAAKRQALAEVGVKVADSLESFHTLIGKMKKSTKPDPKIMADALANRRASLFSTTISTEDDAGYRFVGQSLEKWEAQGDFIAMVLAGLLGRPPKSKLLKDFTTSIFTLGLDHGPNVSGALNTIVTARAGKDLVSSVAAGLLAIGPRFGGAGNEAARHWFEGVQSGAVAADFVENRAKAKQLIMGIGHKKYRLGYPDPRVKRLLSYAKQLKKHAYLDFAQAVEKVTTSKKGNLILNFDGAFAAVLLDILAEKEGLTPPQLKELIDSEFFNAFFVIPRSIGFISHYLDQKRLDEGLFRMPDELIHTGE